MRIQSVHHFVAKNLASTVLNCGFDHSLGASLEVRPDVVCTSEEGGRLIVHVPAGSDLSKVQDALNTYGTTLPAWEVREAPAT